ncbi:MAG: HAD family hydrolase [archaeon]
MCGTLSLSKRKAVFLDRDGVINKKAPEGVYITNWRDFEFLPGVKESIGKLGARDYKIVIITNQRGISKGLMNLEDLEEIHGKMLNEILEAGGRIDKIYFCPHDAGECDCRKPLTGMLDKASKELNIDLEESWVIGDSVCDIEMGRKRKCKTILIGNENLEAADFVAKSLKEAVSLIK